MRVIIGSYVDINGTLDGLVDTLQIMGLNVNLKEGMRPVRISGSWESRKWKILKRLNVTYEVFLPGYNHETELKADLGISQVIVGERIFYTDNYDPETYTGPNFLDEMRIVKAAKERVGLLIPNPELICLYD